MIAIVDYGMGNLRSVQKAFECIGKETSITRDPAIINHAERIKLIFYFYHKIFRIEKP